MQFINCIWKRNCYWFVSKADSYIEGILWCAPMYCLGKDFFINIIIFLFKFKVYKKFHSLLSVCINTFVLTCKSVLFKILYIITHILSSSSSCRLKQKKIRKKAGRLLSRLLKYILTFWPILELQIWSIFECTVWQADRILLSTADSLKCYIVEVVRQQAPSFILIPMVWRNDILHSFVLN